MLQIYYLWPKHSIPYFLNQTLWLLLEVGIYFLGKPADLNDGWMRYIRAIQLGLVDTGSRTRSLSVQLLAVETSRRTQTALALAWWQSAAVTCTRICVPHILAMATIQPQLLFKGGDCWGQYLIEEIRYVHPYSVYPKFTASHICWMPANAWNVTISTENSKIAITSSVRTCRYCCYFLSLCPAATASLPSILLATRIQGISGLCCRSSSYQWGRFL